MIEQFRVEDAISQLAGVSGRRLNILSVADKADHLHWKQEPWGFNPGPDLYRWLYSWGLPYFLRQKLFPDTRLSMRQASQGLYERYFAHYGIRGLILVPGEGLLDYRTGVQINSIPCQRLGPAINVIKLSPEVDFRVRVDCTYAPLDLRSFIRQKAYIFVNTTKVDGSVYRGSVIGYAGDEEIIEIGNGFSYEDCLDKWLKTIGIQGGINKAMIFEEDQQHGCNYLSKLTIDLLIYFV